MPALQILKALAAETADSPEMRYLLSQVVLEARRAFGDAALAIDPGEVPAEPCGAYLLLGPRNVLIGERSLRAMRDRLAAGVPQVRPIRRSDSGIDLAEPIYTLRAFENVEARFLDACAAGSAPVPALPSPAPAVPAVLIAPAALRAILERVPLPRLLADLALLDAGIAPGPVETAGLCHEFIDYYGEIREDVLPFIPADAREVLEVGCGRGVTGAFLQEKLGCRVTGVELHPEVARDAATRLHRVLVGDLQTLEIPERFDAVLGCEIVEHLPEAEAFLARARDLVRPGGRLVFSIPNVGHWSVADDLLAGRWDYLPIGLLCYTHYRFFTRRTLEDWLGRTGWHRFEIHPQKTELPERFARLEGAASGLGFAIDRESLATKGFYVVVEA
ncbi:MAG TPA: class I SAM-dependent methyltransferase [Thermoanaerobaculia bacterium]|nr:class I SAM-dependent methyltransferase [Thermoanaerobaculia bacterium]